MTEMKRPDLDAMRRDVKEAETFHFGPPAGRVMKEHAPTLLTYAERLEAEVERLRGHLSGMIEAIEQYWDGEPDEHSWNVILDLRAALKSQPPTTPFEEYRERVLAGPLTEEELARVCAAQPPIEDEPAATGGGEFRQEFVGVFVDRCRECDGDGRRREALGRRWMECAWCAGAGVVSPASPSRGEDEPIEVHVLRHNFEVRERLGFKEVTVGVPALRWILDALKSQTPAEDEPADGWKAAALRWREEARRLEQRRVYGLDAQPPADGLWERVEALLAEQEDLNRREPEGSVRSRRCDVIVALRTALAATQPTTDETARLVEQGRSFETLIAGLLHTTWEHAPGGAKGHLILDPDALAIWEDAMSGKLPATQPEAPDAEVGADPWRPIAEAPRDGTWLFVTYSGHEDAYCVRWDGARWRMGGIEPLFVSNPTHWMPRPAPPQEDADGSVCP
jgi:hypothetical protein